MIENINDGNIHLNRNARRSAERRAAQMFSHAMKQGSFAEAGIKHVINRLKFWQRCLIAWAIVRGDWK